MSKKAKLNERILRSIVNETVERLVESYEESNNEDPVTEAKKELLIKAAAYIFNEFGVDYDSGSMDQFISAMGFNPKDYDFMDWFYVRITHELGFDEDE